MNYLKIQGQFFLKKNYEKRNYTRKSIVAHESIGGLKMVGDYNSEVSYHLHKSYWSHLIFVMAEDIRYSVKWSKWHALAQTLKKKKYMKYEMEKVQIGHF